MIRVVTLLLLFSTLSVFGIAQVYTPSGYITDSYGNAIKANRVSDGISGTQYLNEVWCHGQIVTPEGKILEVEKMKFNLLLNRIEFDVSGQPMELKIPTQKFSINTPTPEGSIDKRFFVSGFPRIGDQNEKSFYEVLFDGNSKVLKYHKIRVSEYAEAGSMTRTKHYNTVELLYVYHSGKNTIIPISKKRADILAAFDDRKTDVEKFMASKKMKRISESDAMAVCQFYNELTN